MTVPTITVRKLPADVVQRIKQVAAQKGLSMEEEVRETLVQRYMTKAMILERWRQRSARAPRQATIEEAERIDRSVSRWEGAERGPGLDDLRVPERGPADPE
jgi:antitoxin FitA